MAEVGVACRIQGTPHYKNAQPLRWGLENSQITIWYSKILFGRFIHVTKHLSEGL